MKIILVDLLIIDPYILLLYDSWQKLLYSKCFFRILMIILQEALVKSNEVFETFKQEIEKVLLHQMFLIVAIGLVVWCLFLNWFTKYLWLMKTQMAKSIKELKKENTFLKSKCEKSDVTLIELVEEVRPCYFYLE